jgi:AraC family transcriptional regulator of arabinose operon
MAIIKKSEHANFVPESQARDIIQRLDLLPLVAGEACNKEDWGDHTTDFRGDLFFRFYYPTAGMLDLLFSHGLFSVRTGYLYLLPANSPFKYQHGEKFSHYWLHFCSALLEKIPYFQQPLELPAKSVPDVENFIKKFIKLAENSAQLDNLVQMDIILRTLLRPFIASMPKGADAVSIAHLDAFSQVINYIDCHLGAKIAISDLAKLVKMRNIDFSLAFRRAFGVPPKHYICMRRISKAKQYLLATDMSIKQVSDKVGYNDLFFFHRIFKKYTNKTPTNYRKSTHLGNP